MDADRIMSGWSDTESVAWAVDLILDAHRQGPDHGYLARQLSNLVDALDAGTFTKGRWLTTSTICPTNRCWTARCPNLVPVPDQTGAYYYGTCEHLNQFVEVSP